MAKRIALLYGGRGKEHDVSVMGYEYVSELLENSEYEILPVYIDKSGCWYVRIKNVLSPAYPTSKLGGSLYTGCDLVRIYAAIPLLHGDGGEDGSIQGALECAGIPYVGADVCTSAVCLDKAYTKAVASAIGMAKRTRFFKTLPFVKSRFCLTVFSITTLLEPFLCRLSIKAKYFRYF